MMSETLTEYDRSELNHSEAHGKFDLKVTSEDGHTWYFIAQNGNTLPSFTSGYTTLTVMSGERVAISMDIPDGEGGYDSESGTYRLADHEPPEDDSEDAEDSEDVDEDPERATDGGEDGRGVREDRHVDISHQTNRYGDRIGSRLIDATPALAGFAREVREGDTVDVEYNRNGVETNAAGVVSSVERSPGSDGPSVDIRYGDGCFLHINAGTGDYHFQDRGRERPENGYEIQALTLTTREDA